MAGQIFHEWNGTVLTITSDSGTSSADLKGDTGCRGPQGRAGVIVNADGTVDMSGYATETYVTEQIANVASGGTIDLSNYATKQYVDEKVAEGGGGSGSVDLSNYYTKTETDTKIAEAQLGGSVDLSNYYTKSQTDSAIQTAVNNIEIPTVDLSNYYTKIETDSAIQTAIDGIDIPTVDLSNYYTKTQTDDKFYTKQQTDAAIQSAVTATDLSNYYSKTEANNTFAYKTEIPTKVSYLENDANYATQTYVSNTLADYYTKKEVDSAIANVDIRDELANYYTKTEIDNNFYTKTDIDDNYYTKNGIQMNYYTKTQVDSRIPNVSNFITLENVEAQGYQKEDQVNTLIHNVIPSVTSADEGKILTVSSSGNWVAKELVNLEEVSF